MTDVMLVKFEGKVYAPQAGDRRKIVQIWRLLTFNECRDLSGQALYYSEHTHKVHRVKITSVKTWKTRDYIEVHWKYGLRDYGYEVVHPDTPQQTFVVHVGTTGMA
jgi:hypothetical protein